MSKLVTTAVCIWVATAVAGPAVASSVRLDLDTQNRGTDVAMERLFAGNNPDLDVYLWENGSTVLVALSQVWFSYAPLPVTGSVARVRGTYLATNAVSFVGTNVLARNGKYYWDVTRIWQRSGTASNTVTYGRGVFQVDSAHGAGASGSAVFRNVVNWDGIQNVGALPWAGGATNVALAVVNATNALLSARITTAQARADAACVTNAAQTLALAGKQDSSTAATDAELAAASQAGTNNTTAATNGYAVAVGDDRWVNTSGDTMTGDLYMGSRMVAARNVGLYAGDGAFSEGYAAVGDYAGQGVTARHWTAVGYYAAQQARNASGYFGGYFAAFGPFAGRYANGQFWNAVGYEAGRYAQGDYWNAIGRKAGDYANGSYWDAVGYFAGERAYGAGWTALGSSSGYFGTGDSWAALGPYAGRQATGSWWTAAGYYAGQLAKGDDWIAAGRSAGTSAIWTNSGAFGPYAGRNARGRKRVYIDARLSDPGASHDPQYDAIYVDDGAVYLGRTNRSVTVRGTSPLTVPLPGTAALHAATVGQLAATGTAVKAYCSNAANLTGPVPDASIATNTPSASSGMALFWNRTGERFWKWINMLRNSAGTIALDATTAGVLNTQGNVILGGGGTNSYVTIQGTSGNGALTLPAFQVKVGNNGGTTAITVLNNGNTGFGMTLPTDRVQVEGSLTVGSVSTPGQLKIKGVAAGIISTSQIQLSDGNGATAKEMWIGYDTTGNRAYIQVIHQGTGFKPLLLQPVNGSVGVRTNAVHSSISLMVRGISTLGTVSNTQWSANQTFPAGQLANNVPYANVTSALARARAPQALTYTGTNVYSDARLGPFFRVNATNDFRLHKPTNATDGQALKWWIKQHSGGTNTITLVASEFVLPVGASAVTLSVTNGCVDVLAGEWDGVNSRVRVQSFMRYAQ
jgi:hypothetical protein